MDFVSGDSYVHNFTYFLHKPMHKAFSVECGAKFLPKMGQIFTRDAYLP